MTAPDDELPANDDQTATANHEPPRRRSRWRTAGRAVVLEIGPLRDSPRLRWLLLGQLGSHLGRQILTVAVPYQVFVMTESTLLVGVVGLVQVLPLVIGSFAGGALADVLDRHRVLGAVQVGMALTSLGLAANAATSPLLILIFGLVVLHALLFGMEAPTRTSIVPSLTSRRHLPSAFALNQTLAQTAAIGGPALGGLLIASLGIEAAYAVASASLLLASLAMIPLGRSSARPVGGRPGAGSLFEGWRYLRGRPVLQQLIIVDLGAMVLGMPRALFPVIGLVALGGDARTVGLLYSAMGVGSLLCALTTGWVAAVRRQGRVVLISVFVWGASITAFGLVGEVWLALVLLGVAGAANTASTIFRTTILQLAVPDRLRGRVTAVNIAASATGPQLGDAESGAVAELTSPTISVVTGGVASIVATALVAFRGRALWAYHADRS